MASSAACECGAEEQTINHVVLQCRIHQPPHELHGLTVLDDERIEWLLNTCPKIQCSLAVVWLKRRFICHLHMEDNIGFKTLMTTITTTCM